MEKKKKHNQGLSLREALDFCNQRGVVMTTQSLIQAGIYHGFMAQHQRRSWEIDASGLAHYLRKRGEKIPDGWATIAGAAKQLNVPVNTIYWWIHRGHVSSKMVGAGEGVMCVNVQQVGEYRNRSKEHQEGIDGQGKKA